MQNRINFLILILFAILSEGWSQSSWLYLNQTNLPSFYLSAIESYDSNLIVLECSEIDSPNFKRKCKLIKFSSKGSKLSEVDIEYPIFSFYGDALFKHSNYFILIGLITYPLDSFKNEFVMRRYDYQLNLIEEKITPVEGFQYQSMRTKLLHDNFYVSSIYTFNRITKKAINNIIKLDTFGNIIRENRFDYPNSCYFPYDFISVGESKDSMFLGIANSFLIFNQALNIVNNIPFTNEINECSNLVYLMDYDSTSFIYYWLENRTSLPVFDIGLSLINLQSLKISKTVKFGTTSTDDYPTFNRGIQRNVHGEYFISGSLDHGEFGLGSFDSTTFFVAKLDKYLNTIWIKYIDLGYYATSYSSLITSDGGLVITAFISEFNPNKFLPKACLLKIGPNGEFLGTTSTLNSNLLLGILLKKFDDHLEIEIQENFNAIAFTLFDLQGKEIVSAIKLNFGNNKVELPKLLTGVYPFKFFNSRGIVYQGKLLINK